jgi:hypothetical protein
MPAYAGLAARNDDQRGIFVAKMKSNDGTNAARDDMARDDMARDDMARDPQGRGASANMPLFYTLLGGGILVAMALLFVFPNLLGNPGYLALALLTPLLGAATLALMISGARRRVPAPAANLLRGALAVVMALDLAAFVLPIFVAGHTGHDTAPVFVSPTTAQTTQPATSATATPVLATRSGQFDPRSGSHGDSVSGTAILGVTADGSAVLRLQGLQATNGPDLYVYLSKVASPASSAQVMNGLEVSKLKATSGDSNYTLPAGTDIAQFKSVAVYCRSFSTLFGYANLA